MSQVRSQDLILTVSEQSAFDIEPYERFLDQLTLTGGEQQNEALHIAARYLLGGHYASLFELADENWHLNPKIREHHGDSRERFLGSQQLGQLLACSIDHATATGKSWIIFGAAMLALGSGQVDRVLVLCPSNTIEDGLTRKFRELAANRDLMDLIPSAAAVSIPQIVNAYEGTVPSSAICVENIHAAYDRSLSSIRDSFEGQGGRTLVINDEAHHVYTIESTGRRKLKEWLLFLLDPAFGFRRVLNVSGTCFIGDAYFPDVVHRYSLQQARADKRIKDVRYWADSKDFPSADARWTAVLENHQANRARYTGVKPITIFVTDKVAKAKAVHKEFAEFMGRKTGVDPATAADLTLIVSSAPEHKANLPTLKTVDQPENEVEFIFSVSMLTEGWDVKNVLQIVPHEKRAFDSKLLISQVLGRGLRLLPDPYRDAAQVIVFNHAKWAPEMRRLFDDVWEDDQRVSATPIASSGLHLELDLLEVERGAVPVASGTATGSRAAGDPLKLLPQHVREIRGSLVDLAGKGEERKYAYTEPVQALDDLLADYDAKLAAEALEAGADPPDGDLLNLRTEIEAALKTAGVGDDLVSDSNQARIWSWLRPQPKSGTRMAVKTIKEQLVRVSTKDLVAQSVGRRELARDSTIALRTDNERAIRWPSHDTGQYDLLDDILGDEDLPRRALITVTDERRWGTPLDVVIVTHTPERAFLQELVNRGEACGVDAWVKSPDKGFYAVPYTVTVSKVTKNLTFNPDWFLRIGDDILVIETKMDGDTSEENKAKLRAATDYFGKLNAKRSADGKLGTYHFYLLTPADYKAFFDAVCAGACAEFVSTLQAQLS